ncbi:MAG: N-acetyltransferase family protein [Pseudomonadota bacterium]
MQLVNCNHADHANAILAIFNEAIANSTAIYEYQPRGAAFMQEWFAGKERGNFPVIGLVDDKHTLLGFATYGTFRERPAYKYSIEHSLYIHKDHRGRGLGPLLLRHLIELARGQHYHVIMGGVDLANGASIAMHEKLGFQRVGTLPQVGFKFGRWLDLAFYQLVLDTPLQPRDG